MIQRLAVQRVRQWWHSLCHFLIHNLFHADDPPHRLALGVAIGMFVTFTPTVGFQMVVTVFLAWLLGANKMVGVPVVWISNPATIPPIFWSCYYVGRKILGQPSIGRAWWAELAKPPDGWWTAVTFYWSRLLEIAYPMWLGSILIGSAAGLISYYAVYYPLCWYRMKRWGQLTPPVETDEERFQKESAA